MFIYLLLIYLLEKQIEVKAQFKRFGVPKQEIQRLEELKFDLCGLSFPGYLGAKGDWRGIGWFCVNERNCSGSETTHTIKEGTEPDFPCGTLRYNRERNTCCFTGKLKPPVAFEDPKDPDWDLFLFVKEKSKTKDIGEMEAHRRALFKEFLRGEDSEQEVALRNHEICSVLPYGKHKGFTTWTPYICVTEAECKKPKPNNVYVNKEFPFGDRFCSKSLLHENRPVCCHISTVIKEKQDEWQYVEFLSTQKYAPGFRSKFMCEQYNRLVCEGEKDRCAQKTIFRFDNALPGEFPHHALIGLDLPRRQTFHCQGSIISKLFVLTSYDCREEDNSLANIVLVGAFKFDVDNEDPVKEQIVYIKNHISAPEKHWFLLLRLMRPLELSPFVKPACIDWFSYNTSLSSREFDFGTGWIVGYGPFHKRDVFSSFVRRYTYKFNSTQTLDEGNAESLCTGRMPELKKKYFKKKFKDSKNHICVLGTSVYTPLIEKQTIDKSQYHNKHLGYYSQGASFSVFERYCQWKVYGVFIQNKKQLIIPPLLIETIPYALLWIEEIIWKEEFDWIFIDMSWPSCADWENQGTIPPRKGGFPAGAFYEFNFRRRDYKYMRPENNYLFTW